MSDFKLEKTFKGLNLGENFSAAKRALKTLDEKIQEFKKLKCDHLFLPEYFSKLRKEIDTDRETVKQKIDEHYSKLIEKVNEDQAKCKEKSNETENAADNVIKQFNEKLKNLREDLDQVKIDFESWEKIRKDSNYEIKKLNKHMLSYRDELLLNQSYVFESRDLEIETSKMVTAKPIIKKDTNRKNGFACFTIKNVKKIFDDENSTENKVYSQEIELNGTNWYVGIEKRDDGFVGFYFFREENSNQTDTTVAVTLQLINIHEPLEIVTDKFEYKYIDSEGFGFHKFITFQELFDRGFHDAVDDSIDVLVYIKFLDI